MLSAAGPVFGNVVVAVTLEPGPTTAGAVSVNGWLTTSGAVAVTPLTVTRNVVTPTATAVTTPLSFTVATRGSLLLYRTCARDRSANDWSLLTASTMLSAVACGSSSAELVSGAIHGFLPVRSSVSPGLTTT